MASISSSKKEVKGGASVSKPKPKVTMGATHAPPTHTDLALDSSDAAPFKIVLIGESSVGKSSLLCRFADDIYTDSYIATIGVDFRFRTLTIDKQIVKLQIWDTAGQERFRTITVAYYRGADGIILVYDVTDIRTFEKVAEWLVEVERHTSAESRKLLIGNKADLTDERQVSEEMGQSFAEKHGISWLETSAKTGTNVDAAFETLAVELVKAHHILPKPLPGPGRPRRDKNASPCACPSADSCKCYDPCAAVGCRQPRNLHNPLAIHSHQFVERCSCVIL